MADSGSLMAMLRSEGSEGSEGQLEGKPDGSEGQLEGSEGSEGQPE